MDKQLFLEIVMAVVAVFVITVIFLRKVYEKKIVRAIGEGDEATYRKIILHPLAPYLLNSHRTRLWRALCYNDIGEPMKACKEMKHVNVDFLEPKEKVMYVNCASSASIAIKDRKMYESVEAIITHITKGASKSVVDSLMKDYKLNKRLYFDFDPGVIKVLKEKVSELEGMEKGNMQMSLAKAYHFNQQDDMAKETLMKAQENLKNTAYESIIGAMIEDLSLLDE